jgi:acyl-CoA synthetase (AMP-forming)/AMP-acid ligase II
MWVTDFPAKPEGNGPPRHLSIIGAKRGAMMPNRIDESLRWWATYTPDNVAMVSAECAYTYAQLWRRVLRLADSLRVHGLRAGDRVALLMQNSHRYLDLYHTAALLGAAVVPLNFRCNATEIEYVINHSGAATLVFDSSYADMIADVRSRLPAVERYVCAGGQPENTLFYEGLVEAGVERDQGVDPDPAGTYFQGYTSGTTGAPKGCVVPQREFVECLQNVATLYGIDARDIELVVAPLFHEAPAVFALLQLLRGGVVVVTPDSRPANICDLIERYRATWAFMVPTMWSSLVNSSEIDDADLSSLRMLMSGGSPLLTQTKEALLDKLPGAGLNEFYGGTELGLVTNLEPRGQRRKVRCVGKPVPGRFVELRDDHGRRVPQGQVGEVHVSGDVLLKEYFKNPEATAAARGSDGFLTLGDMGRFDEEGYLYIVDRKKDMIISGGENIFPNDVEDILYRHPAVLMAAVVGAPDSKWGEIVVAAVKLKEDASASEQELITHCKTWLSSFKVPRKVDFYQDLPMSTFGKVLRREVRRSYWTTTAVQV